MSSFASSRLRAGLAAVALTLLAAPTVGDIGSCGQPIAELDPVKFFTEKAFIDCSQCERCGLATAACESACSGVAPDAFVEDCYPLVHDGEVCLNALRAATCGAYEGYVADQAPTIATECNFCPIAAPPGTSSSGTGGSGGAGGALTSFGGGIADGSFGGWRP
ncbi:MAG: hypothetical protein KC731_06485 [Myxococcales bacterium]|nr:hypothetical protein [Myxococcales bacterium]